MPPEVIVAGHICRDIIPTFERPVTLEPGKLFKIGPATIATGGAVSNTGLALRRPGVPMLLMGKVGEDLIGRAILERVNSDGMIVVPGETSSYTMVISPPGVDRTLLRCTGANDTFLADDINYDRLAGAVGACCCEAADATGGIRSWDETRKRIAAGWQQLGGGN